MKILMVSSYLPYPLHSGGQVRLYNLIKELSDKHEITLICEKRPHQTAADVAEVEKICKKVITVVRRKQWSLQNIAQSAASSRSFLITGHTHLQMQQKIEEELLNEKFDLIHVETFYVFQNLPDYVIARRDDEAIPSSMRLPRSLSVARNDGKKIPIVLVDHNIEYHVYKRFMDRAPLVMRPLLALDIAKIKKEEVNAWRQATKVVAVSHEDKKVMEENGIHPLLVSNGVNIKQFSFKNKNSTSGSARKILFIGDFKWLQNRDSIEFIIQEIWLKIQSKAKLWIVGREIPSSIRTLTENPNVLFDEKSSAKPTPEIFQEADILLAPIRVGGGTSYKILEAMSCGTPVVTMQMSADAINAKDGQELMVGKNAQDLAEKTDALLENEKLFEKVARGGRKLIEEKYSWKTIAKELENVYKGVVS